MSTRAPNTDTNLVLNGHFNENYEYWEDLVNPGGVDIKRDWWQGEYIKFMTLTNRASVAQTLSVPVDRSAEARYHLSFLYETLHGESGSLKVSKAGGSEEIEIPLPPTRSIQGVTGPLELDLTELTVYLELDLRQGDSIRVTLTSPRNASGDYVSHVRFARIGLHLELAPPQFERLVRDSLFVTPGEPLYLCLGATGESSHVLRFESAQESAWLGTEGALWSEDNPLEAITTLPALGVNQPIDESWTVDCPGMEGDEARLFTLELYSKYTADPYPIAVSLGHHRLVVEVAQEAAYYPVIEYGESVRLGVQVCSFYTGMPIADQEVSWALADEVLHRSSTDREGKAWFDYQPVTDGIQSIEAHVASLYYESGDVVHALEVQALASDPWKELQVRFHNGQAVVWGEQTGFPNRNAPYVIQLVIPQDSPFKDSLMWLLWGDGDSPADLDVTSVPDFGEPVSSRLWRFISGDQRDGRFSLLLGCSRLLRPSQGNVMALAHYAVSINDVREANRSPVVDQGESVMCMLQLVSTSPRKAVADVQVDWVGPRGRFTSFTGPDGWASVIDTPTVAGAYTLTAQVQIPGGGAPERVFPVTALETSVWNNEFRFYLDGNEVDRNGAGVVCWLGQTHTFRAVPRDNSPVIGTRVTLWWSTYSGHLDRWFRRHRPLVGSRRQIPQF